MEAKEYRTPRSYRWRHWGMVATATLLFWGPSVALVVYGAFTPAIVGAIGGTLVVLVLGRPIWRTAERVVLSGIGIEGWTYGGRHTSLPWSAIGEVQRFSRPSWRGPVRIVRLVAPSARSSLTLASWLVGFEEAVDHIERRTLGARYTPAPWWEQM